MLVVRFPLGGNRAHLYGAKSVGSLTPAELQAINGTISTLDFSRIPLLGEDQSCRRHKSLRWRRPIYRPRSIRICPLPLLQQEIRSGKPVSVSFTGSFQRAAFGRAQPPSPRAAVYKLALWFPGFKVPAGTQIVSQFTGAPGGVGLYSLYVPGGIIPSEALTESYGVLTIGNVISGTVADGQQVTDTSGNVLPDTAIESNISGSGAGSQWVVDFAHAVAAENMTMTGAPLSVTLHRYCWRHEEFRLFLDSAERIAQLGLRHPTEPMPSGTAAASARPDESRRSLA